MRVPGSGPELIVIVGSTRCAGLARSICVSVSALLGSVTNASAVQETGRSWMISLNMPRVGLNTSTLK